MAGQAGKPPRPNGTSSHAPAAGGGGGNQSKQGHGAISLIPGDELARRAGGGGGKKGTVPFPGGGGGVPLTAAGEAAARLRTDRTSSIGQQDWMDEIAAQKLNSGKPAFYNVHKEWDYSLKRFRRVARPDTFYMDPKFYAEKTRAQLRLTPLSAIPMSGRLDDESLSVQQGLRKMSARAHSAGIVRSMSGPADPGPASHRPTSALDASTRSLASRGSGVSARPHTAHHSRNWLPPGASHREPGEMTDAFTKLPGYRATGASLPASRAGSRPVSGRDAGRQQMERPSTAPTYTAAHLSSLSAKRDHWRRHHRGVPPGPRSRRELAGTPVPGAVECPTLEGGRKETYHRFLDTAKWLIS